jgi:hypothetical protein
MSTVDLILQRWPLEAMLARCSISIPSKGKFCSPFRPDNSPSCERYKETIKDWSTGTSYDSIAVFAEHKGISNNDAIRQLAAELPGRQPKPTPKKKELVIPPLSYSEEQAEALAKLRGISHEGVALASSLGALWFGKVLGYDCWILTDGSTIAEARRMDGKKFPAVGSLGARKSHTLGGSRKGSPIGLVQKIGGAKARKKLPIALVEGGPDYLALCSILCDYEAYLPVCMLGASSDISPEALTQFAGKTVWIIGHPDHSGKQAVERWGRQLQGVGCTVRGRQLQQMDLNDTLIKHGAEQARKAIFFI